ncbi:hypothetical protein C4553_01015 [Candidatus Parcubacteria bacterium]|nr:MAG: hypothetical protein C4553_01015 [Candidatus Parcubacteria bacterium]
MSSVVAKVFVFGVLLMIGVFLFLFLLPARSFDFYIKNPQSEPKIGLTFSTYYTRDILKLDIEETYGAIIEDLDPQYMRIPIYWPDIEPQKDNFDFSVYDSLIAQASNSQISIIPVIGRRQPRWPECFTPKWAEVLSKEEQEEEILGMLREIVGRYQKQKWIEGWQIENEPFFQFFGVCPKPKPKFLDREIELVRSLDSRPIILTDSGELGWWFGAARRADFFGTTLYRQVWNDFLKEVNYIWPPQFYVFKERITNIFFDPKEFWIIELQAEPWTPVTIPEYAIDAQLRLFDGENLKENLKFAKATGFDRIYLWGAEWWYWLKTKDHSELWDEAQLIFER